MPTLAEICQEIDREVRAEEDCGPEGCPECGCTRAPIEDVVRGMNVRTCAGCGHTWREVQAHG